MCLRFTVCNLSARLSDAFSRLIQVRIEELPGFDLGAACRLYVNGKETSLPLNCPLKVLGIIGPGAGGSTSAVITTLYLDVYVFCLGPCSGMLFVYLLYKTL